MLTYEEKLNRDGAWALLEGRRRDWADVQDVIRTLALTRDFATQLDPSLLDTYDMLWSEAQSNIGDF